MNILYFCQLYPPALYGGGEYIFFQWAKELVKRGHRVFTITQRLVGEKDFEKIEGIYVYRVGPKIKYQGTLPPKIFENLEYVTSAIIKGIILINKHGINIIHSNTYAPAIAGQVCATISRKPHIITVHDVYSLTEKEFWNTWASQRGMAGSLAVIGPFIEKIILRLPAKIFHTVSETSKIDLLKSNVKRIVVIQNGINLKNYEKISPSNIIPKQAVYIGRLVFYKNLDTVIKSMEKVVEKIPDSKLIIIGDGPYRKKLEILVSKIGFNNNIFFMKRISHQQKVKILKNSAFLILPSIYEGFGIVILEAYACKKPVLVSNVMPLPEIVEDRRTGFVVSPFDSDAWAEKIIYLFKEKYLAQEMGIRGYEKLVRGYTIERVVNQLEKLYNQQIAGKM